MKGERANKTGFLLITVPIDQNVPNALNVLTQSRKGAKIKEEDKTLELLFLSVLGGLSEAGVIKKGFHAKPQRREDKTKLSVF